MALDLLLVDDHPLFRNGLKASLEKSGHTIQVTEAPNITEAKQILLTKTIDVCYLDINLPDGNGIRLLKEIRHEYSMSKFIILSMHEDPILVDEAIDRGADGFLNKDASEAEIIQSLDDVMMGKAYFSKTIIEAMNKKRQGDKEVIIKLQDLTPAEQRILKEVSTSKSSKEIGEVLNIHYRTVENYRTKICSKLDISGAGALLRFSLQYKHLIRA